MYTKLIYVLITEKEETGVAPKFIQPLKPQIVKETEMAILECTVIGTPTPNVKWYKGNEEIKPNESRRVSFNPETGVATLEILEPTPEDETIFKVTADNKFGKAECRANLVISKSVLVSQPTVMYAPSIVKPVKATVATSSEDVVLETVFEEGQPKPQIAWLRNGKPIKTDDNYNIIVDDKKSTLKINKKTKSKQKSGKYEIVIKNEKGEARSSGTVIISDEKTDARPPQFIQPIKPQIVSIGDVVILEATVESYPTATFEWYCQSTPITSTPDTRIVTLDNKSVLLISEVSPEFAGPITCRAENAVGSVTCTATLSLVDETVWEEAGEVEYPRFVQRIKPVRVMDGEKVTFNCVVTGKPTPKVQWYHNDKPVVDAKDVVIYQDTEGVCSLAISEVFPENAGEYTCQAVNKVGEAICKSSLIVEAYEYVPDSELGHLTGSEEDLLADKVHLKIYIYIKFIFNCIFCYCRQ